MVLNSFKLSNVTIQIHYTEAFELWDRSGAISRRLCSIWQGLTLSESAQPNQQVLTGNNIKVQTGFKDSVVILAGEKSLAPINIQRIKDTFEVWREELELKELRQVSMRVLYTKNFPSIKEANDELFALKLAKWPDTKVFDQPMESELNSLEILYRFHDQESFSNLKIKAEQVTYQVNLDPAYFTDEESEIKKINNRIVIDFDRGLLGTVAFEKFRIDEWIKGYQHVLRRDIDKVIKES